MSALGHKLAFAMQQPMSALPPRATLIAFFGMPAMGGADLMKFHLDSHHPLPTKTALSLGSSLRMRDRAFHKPE